LVWRAKSDNTHPKNLKPKTDSPPVGMREHSRFREECRYKKNRANSVRG
jgi:hypothetical protein